MHRWYLVHTKPSREALAESNLIRQGYGVYLPRVVQPVLYRGRWREKVTVLFPRYVFLRVEKAKQCLGPVRSTPGITNVVRFGKDYTIVPERVITELQAREDPHSGLHCLDRQKSFSPGNTVKVAAGPFGGLAGIFTRRAGAERAVVLLELLGRPAPVRMRVDNLLNYAT